MVAALMAAMMMVATAAPAFAGSLQQECKGEVINLGGGAKKCPDTFSSPGKPESDKAATPKKDTLSSDPGAGGGKDDVKFDKDSKVVGCGKANTSC